MTFTLRRVRPVLAASIVLACAAVPRGVTAAGERRTFSEARTGCEGGDARACADLGVLYATGEGVARDDVAAFAALRRACDAGEARACAGIYELLAKNRLPPVRIPEATATLRRACGHLIADGCAGLGVYELGRTEDTAGAFELVARACELGDPSTCETVGVTLLGAGMPPSVRPDLPRAARLLGRGCGGDDVPSCSALAEVYLQGLGGVAADPARGLELLDRACARKHEESCFAKATWSGPAGGACRRGVAAGCTRVGAAFTAAGRSDARIAAGEHLLRAACRDGDGEGCTLHGGLLQKLRSDAAGAASAYRRACELRAGEGCARLAALYRDGEARAGIVQDPAAAAAVAQKGCAFRSASACFQVALAYGPAGALGENAARRAEYLRKACDYGEGHECSLLAAMYEVGEGVPSDAAEARRLRKRDRSGKAY
ncbi:tetratricopeptide repeat protein [Anaeromyxobacter oryzae]|uniref:Beta-lactamase n=1 Tax=Anaeromyxobacter oryzae TaxID=2918170 RepID=A0ABN6MU38_9BACT|nr:sel1 repeat family protein [Anaeromyxobacter oryzae]BDG02968.1 hypothetical protein AMOR_19640 [Anaeromyxobacter oryzae]